MFSVPGIRKLKQPQAPNNLSKPLQHLFSQLLTTGCLPPLTRGCETYIQVKLPNISLNSSCGDGIYNAHRLGYGIGYKHRVVYNYEYNNNYYIEVDRQRGGPTDPPPNVVILAM